MTLTISRNELLDFVEKKDCQHGLIDSIRSVREQQTNIGIRLEVSQVINGGTNDVEIDDCS